MKAVREEYGKGASGTDLSRFEDGEIIYDTIPGNYIDKTCFKVCESNTGIIGNSLSQCILDILEKRVDYLDVLHIDCGTKIANRDDLDKVMESYGKGVWWHHNPRLCTELVEYFLYRGMLKQKRLDTVTTHSVTKKIDANELLFSLLNKEKWYE